MLKPKIFDNRDSNYDFDNRFVFAAPIKKFPIVLPIEIIELIIDQLNQHDVMNMALTCRLISKYSQEKLVKRIYVDSSLRKLYRFRLPHNVLAEPLISELRFYRHFSCINYESFIKFLASNNKIHKIKQIIISKPRFNLEFLRYLKIRLNQCEIIIIGKYEDYEEELGNQPPNIIQKTMRINRIDQLLNNNIKNLCNIDNLEIDGHKFRVHTEINLNKSRFKRLYIKNNNHIKINNRINKPIEVENLIIEGIFTLSLSSIINPVKVELLHLRFQLINFEKFENLRNLSLDIMSPLKFDFSLLKNCLSLIKDNQLQFLRLNFITWQHIPDLINLICNQSQSLIQLVIQYGHFDHMWYEITAIEYGAKNPKWKDFDYDNVINHYRDDFDKLSYLSLFNRHFHITRTDKRICKEQTI